MFESWPSPMKLKAGEIHVISRSKHVRGASCLQGKRRGCLGDTEVEVVAGHRQRTVQEEPEIQHLVAVELWQISCGVPFQNNSGQQPTLPHTSTCFSEQRMAHSLLGSFPAYKRPDTRSIRNSRWLALFQKHARHRNDRTEPDLLYDSSDSFHFADLATHVAMHGENTIHQSRERLS